MYSSLFKAISFIKKHLFSISLVIIVVSGIGYFFFQKNIVSSQLRVMNRNNSIFVATGSIQETIKAVGTSKAVSTQKLQFNVNGDFLKIAAWNVRVGQRVKKGEILASLDTRDVDNDIRSAEFSLSNAKINYDKLFTSIKDYQISGLENVLATNIQSLESLPIQIENLKLEKENILTNQHDTIAELERKIEFGQTSLDTLISNTAYTKAEAINTISQSKIDQEYTLITAGIGARSALADAKIFLGSIETSALNLGKNLSDIPSGFAAKDYSGNKRNAAIIAMKGLKEAINSYEVLVSSTTDTSTGTIFFLMEKEDVLSNAIVSASDLLITALDQSIESSVFTQSTIDALKNTTLSYRSKFANYLTATASTRQKIVSLNDPDLVKLNMENTLATQNQNILSTKNTLELDRSNLEEAKRVLKKLESDYSLKLIALQNSQTSLEGTIKTTKENLLSLRNGPTEEEKKTALTTINQAELSLMKAKKKKEDYQIIAGFDGVVSISNGKAGEISTVETNITIEVPDLYEIDVLIDQLDIVKIRPKQETTVSFDSFPNIVFSGSVESIDATPITNQGVVSYTVKIYISVPAEIKLYNNMTATVTIILNEKNGAIIVPSTAIHEQEGKKMVRVFDDNRIKLTEVETGISSGGMTEILSGLQGGEKIAHQSYIPTTNTGSTSGFSIFGGLGGGRRTP